MNPFFVHRTSASTRFPRQNKSLHIKTDWVSFLRKAGKTQCPVLDMTFRRLLPHSKFLAKSRQANLKVRTELDPLKSVIDHLTLQLCVDVIDLLANIRWDEPDFANA